MRMILTNVCGSSRGVLVRSCADPDMGTQPDFEETKVVACAATTAT